MAYLRFTRDVRGYEHTYLVHTGATHGKPVTRILYWFRTPPNVRVGRAALDEAAVRLIEELHPEIEFDWPQILKTTIPAAAPPPFDGFRKPRRSTPSSTERPVPKPETVAVAAGTGEPDADADALARKRARRGGRRRGRPPGGTGEGIGGEAETRPNPSAADEVHPDDQDPSSVV